MKHLALMSLCVALCGSLLAQEPVVKQMSKADFLTKVMNYEENPTQWVYLGDKPCIVDFYADWCGPCKMMSPVVEKIAKEYSGKAKVGKVNVDEQQELARQFGIMSIPSFVFIKNGKKVDQAMGAMPPSALEARLARII